MRDIKTKKIINKSKESVEKSLPDTALFADYDTVAQPSKRASYFSIFSFGFMLSSLTCFIFLVSSSVFYAVRISQLEYKTAKISSNDYISISDVVSIGEYSDRISYINETSDTAITLR